MPPICVAVVQPGVITQHLQEAVERQGLLMPARSGQRARSAQSAGISPRTPAARAAIKYGVTRDYVLGLEVVLADGTIVKLGSRTHKNKTGFDLARLFVGSEGLLGVVTEATLKLLPKPPYRACLAIGFSSMAGAARTIHAIFAAGFLPCALEIADSFTLAAARRRTGSKRLGGCHAHLIVELDGQPESVRSEIKKLRRIVSAQRPRFIEVGLGDRQCEEIWKLRREFSFALRDTGLTKLNEDIVVPRSRLEDLFRFTARLQKKHQLPVACFGHAGDGNIHVNVMVDPAEPAGMKRAKSALDELFRQVLAWRGVITGEHGIGLAKLPWWPLAVSGEVRDLHRRIKHALDGAGILNPGKFVQ